MKLEDLISCTLTAGTEIYIYNYGNMIHCLNYSHEFQVWIWTSHKHELVMLSCMLMMTLWSVCECIVFFLGKKLSITWDTIHPMNSSCSSWFWSKLTVQCKGYVQWCHREWCIVADTCCGTSYSPHPPVTGNVVEIKIGRNHPEIRFVQLASL